MDAKDKEYFLKHHVLPQYEHLKGIEKAMPVIRKILGISPNGQMPDNFIGRTMQGFIEANREKAVREGRPDINSTLE